MIDRIFFIIICFSIIFFITTDKIYAGKIDYTQEDRDRIIKIETSLNEFKDSVDKRFEQIDKRFEQSDNRFGDMFTFLWILTGIFTTFVIAVFGFAFWDRRTVIRKAKEETIEHIEKSGLSYNLLLALREYAKNNKELKDILNHFNLF